MKSYFIDANIILRLLITEDEDMSKKSLEILEQIENQRFYGNINCLVIHEILYVLDKIYKVPRDDIVKDITKIVSINNLKILDITKESLMKILNKYSKSKLDFADILYNQICIDNNFDILSYDKDFDKLDVSRHESVKF